MPASAPVKCVTPVLPSAGGDVTVNGDVWFRQRSFDLLAQVAFDRLSTVVDAQILAINSGELSFTISDQIVLTTGNVLVLNRRLGGVDLNGGRGFAFGAVVETGILGDTFVRNIAPAGITPFAFGNLPGEEITLTEPKTIVLLLIMASNTPALSQL